MRWSSPAIRLCYALAFSTLLAGCAPQGGSSLGTTQSTPIGGQNDKILGYLDNHPETATQGASIGAPATEAPPADSSASGPPAEFAGYDAELHAICDKDMEEMYSYEIEQKHDPKGEWRRSIWRGWHYFPDRWQSCRSLEQNFCKDPSNVGQEYLDYYVHLKHPTYEQTQLAAQSKTLVEGKQANCENVKQLDSLMQRFEAAASASERENRDSLRALRTSPVPVSPAPTYTDCKPTLSGGVRCFSY
jgi:hypothetical protein